MLVLKTFTNIDGYVNRLVKKGGEKKNPFLANECEP